ncbi:uncharacterized protein LOC117102151 [Anneissia japonica]|uniref:uncharacterized protein LOC117102151 n=1 Tax=Anneissia japonica TaxID=1529436 RepID=UPI0014258DA1|nr:uncharacterized protein LOC117102151 [Anneissia japonica]
MQIIYLIISDKPKTSPIHIGLPLPSKFLVKPRFVVGLKQWETTQEDLIIQDLREANLLEKELQQEKIDAFIQLLKIFLFKFASKGCLEENFCWQFSSQYEQEFYDVFVSIEAEKMVAGHQIAANSNSKKDLFVLEEAIEDVQREGARKLDMKFQEYQLKIQEDLDKNSELSEEEELKDLMKTPLHSFNKHLKANRNSRTL